MSDNFKFWEDRSQKFGARIEGVLLKSVPENINDHLNNWMLSQVKDILEKKRDSKILDIGCGYGRISLPLSKIFPEEKFFGVDVAQNYVDLYNKNLKPIGEAVKADSRNLPFEDNYFDGVFMVTSLMYLINKDDQLRAVREMMRVLKPGGQFCLLERSVLGYGIFTLGGIVGKLRGRKNQEISAVSFSPDIVEEMVTRSGGKIKIKNGIPIFTSLFPIIFVLSFINRTLGNLFLGAINFIDGKLSRFYYPSLYISYSGQKNG